jgi:protoporphyrinogen oxidase
MKPLPDFGFTRRRFLKGVALLGVAPLAHQVASVPGVEPGRQWTGDNFEEAHELLRNPYALLESASVEEGHPGQPPFDAIIVGGGISGLTVAHQLRDRNILLLERDRQTGGVSKSERWNGIEYALGAAYMIFPAPDPAYPDSPDAQNERLLKELGLLDEGRLASGDENHCVFTNRRVVPHDRVYNRWNIDFFEHVLYHKNYPAIPAEDRELIRALDSISYQRFLRDEELQRKIYGRTVGALSPEAWEAIEYYFWGAFGTNTWETSAYHGLNFFAAEFTEILVFPGGNAYIARRLTDRINQERPGVINTGYYVLRIQPRETGGWDVLAYRNRKVYRFRARTVVFSSPLFLARMMIPTLPEEQREAIETLDYRSYVVANVLVRRRMDEIFAEERFVNGYELTRIHGVNPQSYPPAELSNYAVYSDVVTADFPVGRAEHGAVLTVYRPFPYADGRDRLRYLTYSEAEKNIRKSVLEGLREHGLRESDIEDIRLTRWGHPMLIARPGQLADGTMERARAPLEGGLFFAHTDIQGAPAIENALVSAFGAVEAVEEELS